MKRFLILMLASINLMGQDYFTQRYAPFDSSIPSPEQFLEYAIGSQHTRHDQIVAYFETLASHSDQAQIIYYGKTHEEENSLY